MVNEMRFELGLLVSQKARSDAVAKTRQVANNSRTVFLIPNYDKLGIGEKRARQLLEEVKISR